MNENICEIIQTAILSDETLTDEQLNHVENCPECKALLSQVKDMKEGLSGLCVPGLEEGQITKSVMERIRREKTSIPMPKFKITHHLGTAAAVVIILVAALMIKNPSDVEISQDNNVENSPTIFVQKQNNHTLSEAIPEQEENVMFRLSAATTNVLEENAIENEIYADDASYDEENSAMPDMLMMKSAPPSPDIEENLNEPMLLSDTFDADIKANASSGGGGGGGGSSTALLCDDEEAENAGLIYKEYIFDGISFSLADEDYNENIRIANARLLEVFGEGYVISKEKLDLLGIDNKTFVEIANSLTKETFNFYKTVIDIFE